MCLGLRVTANLKLIEKTVVGLLWRKSWSQRWTPLTGEDCRVSLGLEAAKTLGNFQQ